MNKEEKQRLSACLNEIGEILYNNSSTEQVETLEAIETNVRQQILEYISPKIALFLSKNKQEQLKEESEKSKVV
jgi:hypothetical protein